MSTHEVIFVPEEDPDGYLLVYPEHIPLKGQQVEVHRKDAIYRNYEVTDVRHMWKRQIDFSPGERKVVTTAEQYTVIVEGKFLEEINYNDVNTDDT